MGLEIPKLEPKGAFVVADQDYFLTAGKTELVTDEKDPAAAFLLARKGQMIPLHIAKEYGLVENEKLPEDFRQKLTQQSKASKPKQSGAKAKTAENADDAEAKAKAEAEADTQTPDA